MTYSTRPVAALALIGLAGGCGAIRQAHDQRVVAWERDGITVDQARDILGTPPYAVPDLEIVAIHLDAPPGRCRKLSSCSADSRAWSTTSRYGFGATRSRSRI